MKSICFWTALKLVYLPIWILFVLTLVSTIHKIVNMGIRIDTPDYPRGNDCPSCTPPSGSLFASGDTPEFVYVTFFDIVPCSGYTQIPPNGRPFKLTQNAINKCLFEHYGSVWIVRFYFRHLTGFTSLLTCNDIIGKTVFAGNGIICPFEHSGIDSYLLICSSSVKCVGGYGVISWLDIPRELMDDMGIVYSTESFYEMFLCADDDAVHRFAYRPDGTNVKIKRTP